MGLLSDCHPRAGCLPSSDATAGQRSARILPHHHRARLVECAHVVLRLLWVRLAARLSNRLANHWHCLHASHWPHAGAPAEADHAQAARQKRAQTRRQGLCRRSVARVRAASDDADPILCLPSSDFAGLSCL